MAEIGVLEKSIFCENSVIVIEDVIKQLKLIQTWVEASSLSESVWNGQTLSIR